MNKTRIVLAATGGVIALAVLVMACLAWLAFSERSEALSGGDDNEGLEQALAAVEKLQRKNPFPSEENRRRLEANRQAVEDWCASVRKEISRGDWCAAAGGTPALFKEQIATEAKRVLERKEAIVNADFSFGPFKDYLADKMPSAAQLPKLQRQWYDVTSLIDVLTTNGVTKLVDLQVVERSGAAAADDKAAKAKKPKAGAKAKSKTGAQAKAGESEAREPSVETYRLTFVARPAAFAGVVRTLSFQDRFTVIESFGFVRESDTIAEALGGGEKKEAAAAVATGRGRRRRGGGGHDEPAKAQEKGEGEKKGNAVVFDPESDSPVKVDLTVSVYDFRSLEDVEGEAVAK